MDIVEEMAMWFIGDTIELFDNVLEDSNEHPKFSAVTAAKRIQLYLDYKNDSSISSITEHLLKGGYNMDDLNLFYKKYDREFPYYCGNKDNIKLK